MARLKLNMPQKYLFATDIDVRITDINYGNHLGNDSLLAIIHEARVQFLNRLGYSEMSLAGAGIMMADVVIIYKAQAFYGDRLRIEIGVDDISKKTCDFYYRITKDSEKIVALSKSTIVFFDFEQQKPVGIPEAFLRKVGA